MGMTTRWQSAKGSFSTADRHFIFSLQVVFVSDFFKKPVEHRRKEEEDMPHSSLQESPTNGNHYGSTHWQSGKEGLRCNLLGACASLKEHIQSRFIVFLMNIAFVGLLYLPPKFLLYWSHTPKYYVTSRQTNKKIKIMFVFFVFFYIYKWSKPKIICWISFIKILKIMYKARFCAFWKACLIWTKKGWTSSLMETMTMSCHCAWQNKKRKKKKIYK